jgi:hypothetical protein
LPVAVDGLPAAGTVPGYLILEKFNVMPAGFALDVEDRISAPILCVVAATFSHVITFSITLWSRFCRFCHCSESRAGVESESAFHPDKLNIQLIDTNNSANL